nr:hypothetical protein [Tanacetum cinerariifolium]
MDMDIKEDEEEKDDEGDYEDDKEWLMVLVMPSKATGSPPSTYEVEEIGGLCIRAENLEHGHETLVRKMEDVSDAQVDDGIVIGELRPRVTTLEGGVEVSASQHDEVVDKVIEVEEQVLKMQDKVDNYPCEWVDGSREDVDELFRLR